MNLSPKTHGLQTYQTVVYGRAPHPEFFTVKARRGLKHAGMDLEAWLLPGAHVLRIQLGSSSLAELVLDGDRHPPEQGIIHSAHCLGEYDYEKTFEAAGMHYIHSIQTETLSDNIFESTLDEMRDHIREQASLHYEWTDAKGRCLSAVDMQKFGRELHVQSYHLVATGGFVARTQTIFEAR